MYKEESPGVVDIPMTDASFTALIFVPNLSSSHSMYRGFRILAFTHRHHNLRDISRFMIQADSSEELKSHLHAVKMLNGIEELMYLSTCNRVMYLFYMPEGSLSFDISKFLQTVNSNIPLNSLEQDVQSAQYFEGADAINHVLEVAASLDSMIIGEREIFRQIRESYEQSKTWNLSGDNLRLLMKLTVQAAKDVYTNTGIGDKPVSVVSLSIQQLLQKQPSRDARILLIGGGQTNLLVSKFLVKHGYKKVETFNRTPSRAMEIAKKFGKEAKALTDLLTHDNGFDVVFICTGSLQPLLTGDLFQQLAGKESHGRLIIDLSVPANVSTEVQLSDMVDYIDVEHLRHLADQNLGFRREETGKARQIIQKHIASFKQLFHERLIERAMSEVPAEIKAMRQKAVDEVFKKDLDSMDPKTREVVDSILSYMEKKCISIPIKAVKQIVLSDMPAREKAHL
ncbi:MAG: glutamyl-tRNA reductase [Saprospiraceae bacterium]|nr:glutamyl-tRNA reductase [Saprospiraceae bacterium]